MTVVTNNTIQPSSGQALTIKDEGGTASITVQTDGDLTLTENAYLGSGKGIYFDGQTTSANFLDDYEEGTWTPTNTYSGSLVSPTGRYVKVGRMVYLQGYFQTHGTTAVSDTYGGIPFVIGSTEAGRSGGWVSYNANEAATYSILLSSAGNSAFSFYKGAGVIVIGTSKHMYFSLQYIID